MENITGKGFAVVEYKFSVALLTDTGGAILPCEKTLDELFALPNVDEVEYLEVGSYRIVFFSPEVPTPELLEQCRKTILEILNRRPLEEENNVSA